MAVDATALAGPQHDLVEAEGRHPQLPPEGEEAIGCLDVQPRTGDARFHDDDANRRPARRRPGHRALALAVALRPDERGRAQAPPMTERWSPSRLDTWPETRSTPRRDPGAERPRAYIFLLPGARGARGRAAHAAPRPLPVRSRRRGLVDLRTGDWQSETRAVDELRGGRDRRCLAVPRDLAATLPPGLCARAGGCAGSNGCARSAAGCRTRRSTRCSGSSPTAMTMRTRSCTGAMRTASAHGSRACSSIPAGPTRRRGRPSAGSSTSSCAPIASAARSTPSSRPWLTPWPRTPDSRQRAARSLLEP